MSSHREETHLGVTSSGTKTWVIGTRLIKLVAQVRPGVGAVAERSVHDGGVELLDSGVGTDGASEGGAGVGVGSSNGNLEVGLPLSVVDCGLAVKASTPEGALDVGKGVRVPAASARLDHRIPFKIDIEAQASLDGVALVGAPLGVVTSLALVDDSVTEVRVGVVSTGSVLEVVQVARRGRSAVGGRGDVGISLEVGVAGDVDVEDVGNGGLGGAGSAALEADVALGGGAVLASGVDRSRRVRGLWEM
jgi:hypothetical protein